MPYATTIRAKRKEVVPKVGATFFCSYLMYLCVGNNAGQEASSLEAVDAKVARRNAHRCLAQVSVRG
jgi:hypothetical protein